MVTKIQHDVFFLLGSYPDFIFFIAQKATCFHPRSRTTGYSTGILIKPCSRRIDYASIKLFQENPEDQRERILPVLATFISNRRASFTDLSSGKASATSGASSTRFVPSL